MYQSVNEFEDNIVRLLESNKLNEALASIQAFVKTIVSFDSLSGVIFSSSFLDSLCQQIGMRCAEQHQIFAISSQEQPDLVIYIASELFLTGGHTAVIEDLIKYQPDKQHVIIITKPSHLTHQSAIDSRFSTLPVKLLWASANTFLENLVWLQSLLRKYNPGRTFLFNHHEDSVAIAATIPRMVSELFFYHHGDHNLCLGVHLQHAIHIDPHPMGFYNCRHRLGVKNNIYWPLTAIDQGVREQNRPFCHDGVVRTCSSGNENKFLSRYQFSYVELVPQILQSTQGQHIHIGPLPETSLNQIYYGIAKAGISKDRFLHIPWTRNLWRTLLDHHVDLYITSFPHGGGRTSIEAMGAGIPIIAHSNYRSQFLGGECLIYPEALCWKKPIELLQFLMKIDKDFLMKQSAFARVHYERFHLPEILEKELKQKIPKGLTPPELPLHEVDRIQIFLEQEVQKREELENMKQCTLNSIYASNSWRITKPLRDLNAFFSWLKAWFTKQSSDV